MKLIFLIIFTFFSVKSNAYSAFSYDLSSGEVIFSKNELEKIYPASLTKIMTVYLAIDAIKSGKFSLFDLVEVPHSATLQPRTSAGLRAGEKISMKDLIMLTGGVSANDAAYVIAYHVGGENVGNFVNMMNEKAAEIGMQSTHFANPNGLHDEEQYSTSRDLSLLLESFLKNNFGYIGAINSNNFFLEGKMYSSRNPIGRNYKCIKAHKTGFTNASGYNIISYSSCGNYNFITNVIGLKTSAQRNDYFVQVLNYSIDKISGGEKKSFFMENELTGKSFVSDFFISLGTPFVLKNKDLKLVRDSGVLIYDDYFSESFEVLKRRLDPFPKMP